MESYFVFVSLLYEVSAKRLCAVAAVIGVVFLVMILKSRYNKRKMFGNEDFIEGFACDSDQNIFYMKRDAPQKKLGCCGLYDDLTVSVGNVVDCEPLYFEYEGKKWLIELWKGQYGIMTGCEIGVYTSVDEDIYIPGIFSGTFYRYTLDEDNLNIKVALMKNSDLVFVREDVHWRLNGFVFGKFSNPDELLMQVSITLKSKQMCDLFVDALKRAGYLDFEIIVFDDSVRFIFDKPRTIQPKSQRGLKAILTQIKNLLMCDIANHITQYNTCADEKLLYLHIKNPWLCDMTKLVGTKMFKGKYKEFKKHI